MAMAAGRDRQATRELIKAYGAGATLDELRETFILIHWSFGVSYTDPQHPAQPGHKEVSWTSSGEESIAAPGSSGKTLDF
jgi:hypothetical protein